MRPRRPVRLAASLAFVACAGLPPVHAVVLRGPEILKLGWNTRALQATDLDGDGRQDLLVINNDRAALELLYQLAPGESPAATPAASSASRWEPVLEDARFRKDSLITGAHMFDLVTGDFDGDGRVDLAYTGDPRALTLQLRTADGGWREREVPSAPAPLAFVSGLRAADLDGDGRAEIVLLGQKELAVFRAGKSGGEVALSERHALPEDNNYGLELVDADGDGRLDVVYLSTGAREAVRLRRQNAAGRFGPEEIVFIKPASSTLQTWAVAGQPPRFAYVQNATGQIEVFKFAAHEAGDPLQLPAPRVFTPRVAARTPALSALADIDGDGRTDVVTADPDGAQLVVHLRESDGGFTAGRRFPSAAEIRGLAAADWDGDGKAEVFVLSTKEQLVGVCHWTPEGRLGFPQPLTLSAKPVVLAAGDFDGDSRAELAVVTREGNNTYLALWAPGEDGAPAGSPPHSLAGKGEPKGLFAADLDQDGRCDLLALGGLEPVQVLVSAGGDAWRVASNTPGFLRGLLEGADLAGLGTADTDGDGKAELLVCTGGGFARALRLGAGDALEIVEQFNARESTAQVTGAIVLPATQSGARPRVVLYDRKGEQLQLLRADDGGVFDVAATQRVGRIDLTGIAASGSEAFLFGKDRFWWLPLASTQLEAETLSSHLTDLPEVTHGDVIAGDLDADGQAELVCIDPEKNMIEVLGAAADEEGWESRLHFKVFEADAHYQGRGGSQPEPRETIVADVTGDGKNDLVLLVHDRVLVYPQE